jgi:hypothetical protein
MGRAIMMVLTDYCFGWYLKVRQNLTLVEKERHSVARYSHVQKIVEKAMH